MHQIRRELWDTSWSHMAGDSSTIELCPKERVPGEEGSAYEAV